MIIQVRGTSGSGKSTVVREVIASFGGIVKPEYIDGRRMPLRYWINDLAVLGHYESPCGGCDTIGSARAVYELIQTTQAKHILCEGLLLSEDCKWSSQLTDLRVLFLTTPLEKCLKRIEGRRAKAGNTKPLNPLNTSNRVAVIERARIKLTEAGVYCRRCTDKQAPEIIRGWLGCR